MKPLPLLLSLLSTLVAANDHVFKRNANHLKLRQANAIPSGLPVFSFSYGLQPNAPGPAGPATPLTTTSTPHFTFAAGTPAQPNPPGPAATSTPSFTFTLAATNPTAVPLSVISASQFSAATLPLPFTATVGSTPTFLPGAPPLPDPSNIHTANYPTADKIPPTDSPEVQQWIKEVADTGVVIPNITLTVPGGCPLNPDAVADTSRCWWTCGGCTTPSDITECPTHMDWGLTYDDGPAPYTTNLLEYLTEKNLKSTFFVVGSRVLYLPAVLQAEYMGQHQIAVHTWSHPSLTQLTNEQIIAELGWSKKIIQDTLGVTPNMMRPPYGDIDNRVRAISIAMGLQPVIWSRISPLATFDTDDFNIHSGLTSVQQVLQNWENIIGNATTRQTGFIVLEHDLFEEPVEVAIGYILPDALAHQPPFNIRPVISCLNRPMANAYIETNDNTTNPPVISMPGAVTIDPSQAAKSKKGEAGRNFRGYGLAALTATFGAIVSSILLML